MIAWTERAFDEANLLNPAFCGRLLGLAVHEHGAAPMPFATALLILPLALHKATREALPRSPVRSPLITWVGENQQVRLGLAGRVQRTLPSTREALLFLSIRNVIAFEGDGIRCARPVGRSSVTDTDEVRRCATAARFLGRWLSRAGTPESTYAILGLTP
jgi:hypothetical protein